MREATPYSEEHAKMFAPLGFFRGLTDEQQAAVARRGGWADADFPTIDRQMQSRSWFCGTGDEMIAYLQELQEQFPGLETVNMQIEHGHAGVGDAGATGALRGGGDAGVPDGAGGERGGVDEGGLEAGWLPALLLRHKQFDHRGRLRGYADHLRARTLEVPGGGVEGLDQFIGKPGRDLAHGELRAMSFEVKDMTFLSRR